MLTTLFRVGTVARHHEEHPSPPQCPMRDWLRGELMTKLANQSKYRIAALTCQTWESWSELSAKAEESAPREEGVKESSDTRSGHTHQNQALLDFSVHRAHKSDLA